MRDKLLWTLWVIAEIAILFGYQEGILSTWVFVAIGWGIGLCVGLMFNAGAHIDDRRESEKQDEN